MYYNLGCTNPSFAYYIEVTVCKFGCSWRDVLSNIYYLKMYSNMEIITTSLQMLPERFRLVNVQGGPPYPALF